MINTTFFFTIISFVFLEYTNWNNNYTIKNYKKQINRKKNPTVITTNTLEAYGCNCSLSAQL